MLCRTAAAGSQSSFPSWRASTVQVPGARKATADPPSVHTAGVAERERDGESRGGRRCDAVGRPTGNRGDGWGGGEGDRLHPGPDVEGLLHAGRRPVVGIPSLEGFDRAGPEGGEGHGRSFHLAHGRGRGHERHRESRGALRRHLIAGTGQARRARRLGEKCDLLRFLRRRARGFEEPDSVGGAEPGGAVVPRAGDADRLAFAAVAEFREAAAREPSRFEPALFAGAVGSAHDVGHRRRFQGRVFIQRPRRIFDFGAGAAGEREHRGDDRRGDAGAPEAFPVGGLPASSGVLS